MSRKTKNTLLILAVGLIFSTGSIGCSRNVRVTALEGDIVPAPVGSVLHTETGQFPVVRPSYLVTQDFMERIARARVE